MTAKQLMGLTAPDGSQYITLTDGNGNLVTAGGGGGGSGTVTSVSVTTANGVSGSVATATTTPAISLTLGAITPTSVAIGAGSAITSSGAGGSLGTNAFNSTAYAPIASPTFTGTVTLPDASTFGTNFSIAGNAKLTAPSAAVLQHGAADAAAPVAQTIQAQSVVAGTSNTAGVDWTFAASRGTGTGAGGKIIFQTANVGSTGSTQNALANRLTINTDGLTYIGAGAQFGGSAVNPGVDIMYLASGIGIANSRSINWSSTANGAANSQVAIAYGGAAGRVGVNNAATAAAIFDIYGTTDVSGGAPTNYERISITKAVGGAATVDVQNGGTGAVATQFAIKLAGTTKVDFGITSSTWSFVGNVATSSSFGASFDVAAARSLQVGGSLFSPTAVIQSPSSGVITLWEAVSGTTFNRLQFGGTTASFGAVARDGAGIKIVGADGTSVSWIKVPGVVVASLPSASTAGVGAISFVTDANTTVILGLGATVVGGGANKVPVYSDGTNWIVG